MVLHSILNANQLKNYISLLTPPVLNSSLLFDRHPVRSDLLLYVLFGRG